MNLLASIPSPSSSGFHLGPLFVHAYGIAYIFAVAAAIVISRRGWRRVGDDPDLPYQVAMWGFPAGLIGGRIYFDVTTPSQIPDHWWGGFAVWQGGLGIWGGIAGGVIGGWLVLRKQLPPGKRAVHGGGRPWPARGAGDRPDRKLLQPGVLRRPLASTVGVADRSRPSSAGLSGLPHIRAHLLVRNDLGSAARGPPAVAGHTATRPRSRPIRALRRGVHRLSHLRRDPARRLLQLPPRNAHQLLGRLRAVPAGAAHFPGGPARLARHRHLSSEARTAGVAPCGRWARQDGVGETS